MFEFQSDINRVTVGFGWISLPNCTGVLGYDKFKVNSVKESILITQAVVDSEGRFLDVSSGWPGDTAFDVILRKSEFFQIGEKLSGNELSNVNVIPLYLLGEKCLPMLPWLLTPYIGDELNEVQEGFNEVHRKGMEFVDVAFGRLRARWEILSEEWKGDCVEAFPFVIVACCLLHNFLIKCSEDFPEKSVGYKRDWEVPVFDGEVDESGKRIRDALALHLDRVSQRR